MPTTSKRRLLMLISILRIYKIYQCKNLELKSLHHTRNHDSRAYSPNPVGAPGKLARIVVKANSEVTGRTTSSLVIFSLCHSTVAMVRRKNATAITPTILCGKRTNLNSWRQNFYSWIPLRSIQTTGPQQIVRHQRGGKGHLHDCTKHVDLTKPENYFMIIPAELYDYLQVDEYAHSHAPSIVYTQRYESASGIILSENSYLCRITTFEYEKYLMERNKT